MHAWVEINLDYLKHNFFIIKKSNKTPMGIIPIIKSAAYGCGSEVIAKSLQKKEVNFFGVANIKEAVFLRDKKIKKPLLILGFIDKSQYSLINLNKLTPTIFNFSFLNNLGKWATKNNCKIPIHLKFDTGMGRLGLTLEELPKLIKQLKKYPHLKVDGIYSHFSVAYDSAKKDYTIKQQKQFKTIIENLNINHIKPKYIHIANSAGAFSFTTNLFCNLIRSGIALYGLSYNSSCKVNLKPVLSLKSKIVMIKDVPANTPISYGQTFITKKHSRIATVSIGYADGVNRNLSNNGRVLVKGKYFPIVGTVTMNFIMIDLGINKKIKEGDDVILIGKSGNKYILIDEIAKRIGTINYEVQCSISSLLPRIYIEKNKKNIIKESLLG